MFFQDGCGVYAREPYVARSYLDELVSKLGKQRVRVIAEAFRPAERGGFRAASADELSKQLVAYRGYSVYLFDGPHYVSDDLTRALDVEAQAAAARACGRRTDSAGSRPAGRAG